MKSAVSKRYLKPLKQYLKKRLLKPVKLRLQYALAGGYRYILGVHGKVCFIGVTGSCGKTTTTELIAAILAKHSRVRKRSHQNTLEYVAGTILTVSPLNHFCVSELSGDRPGLMGELAKLLRPQIGVVTNIGNDHYGYFRSLALTAREKAKLIEILPADGTAVLNADDPFVLEMRKRTKAKVITYGLTAEAMVRGECLSSVWPRPMSLDVCFAGTRLNVQTRLLGEHWAYAVLAAVSVGIAAGVPLEAAAEAIGTFDPILYRMSPHPTPGGVTFICDNRKAPLWTIPASLDFMSKANARRKIAVIGTISDTPKSFFRTYQAIIRQSLGIVDKTIFAGPHALTALRAKPDRNDERVIAFDTLYKLNAFLIGYLEPGDLILIKGNEPTDHLYRLVLSRTEGITCWRQNCGKRRFCTDCRLLHEPPASVDEPSIR
jgi:UDP-N-acetylmuramoyl-tripeptide--D-alanyl-D-alanine ligase